MRDHLQMRPIRRVDRVALDALWVALWRRRHQLQRSVRRTDTEGFWSYWLQRQLAPIPRSSSGDGVAILLVHGRPWTLQTQLAACLQASRIGRVVVSCNSPDASLHRVPLLSHPRVELRMADPAQNQLRRFAVAVDQDADRFVLIDDDLFVEPTAIDFLCQSLDESPAAPCGIIGQSLQEDGDWAISVTARHGRVDVLNCIYACTHEHAVRAFALADELQWTEAERYSYPADDVLISFAGKERPRVHGLSFIKDPAAQARTATFRLTRFDDNRRDWVNQLQAMTGIPAAANEDNAP